MFFLKKILQLKTYISIDEAEDGFEIINVHSSLSKVKKAFLNMECEHYSFAVYTYEHQLDHYLKNNVISIDNK